MSAFLVLAALLGAAEPEPAVEARDWRVPFATRDRSQFSTLTMVSEFGAPRMSYVRGHVHTAVDLAPRPRQDGAKVFPAAAGVVVSIHLDHPHKTLVLKHRMPGGGTLYTSYKHLERIIVKEGDQVTPETELGRLYTAVEAKAQGGAYDHLHFEVRKDFADLGAASWTTMTRAELDAHFLEPWGFLRRQVERPRVLVINPARDKTDLALVDPLVAEVQRLRPSVVEVRHYLDVTPQGVKTLAPTGILVAGQTTPWSQYPAAELAPVQQVLRETSVPVLGICGGHQLLALAHGAPVDFLRPAERADSYAQCTAAAGAVEMTRVRTDPLLRGVADHPRFWSQHCEEVKALPKDFQVLLRSPDTGVEMMRHVRRPVWGVQFHPERAVDGDASGERVLLNFLDRLKPAAR